MVNLVRKKDGSENGKDAIWMMNYQPSGCKEFLEDGALREIYTFLWGNRREDARMFQNKNNAQAIANKAGHCVVVSMKRGDLT